MTNEVVYRYRIYDIATDEYIYSTRYATMKKINRIKAEPLDNTSVLIDPRYLDDGWTKKGFDANSPE
jgi:hypothetical protein